VASSPCSSCAAVLIEALTCVRMMGRKEAEVMEKKKDCDHESLFECRGRKWWESAWLPLGARTPRPKDKACAARETPSGRLQFERVGVASECGQDRLAVPARGGC